MGEEPPGLHIDSGNLSTNSGIILGMGLANERRYYLEKSLHYNVSTHI